MQTGYRVPYALRLESVRMRDAVAQIRPDDIALRDRLVQKKKKKKRREVSRTVRVPHRGILFASCCTRRPGKRATNPLALSFIVLSALGAKPARSGW